MLFIFTFLATFFLSFFCAYEGILLGSGAAYKCESKNNSNSNLTTASETDGWKTSATYFVLFHGSILFSGFPVIVDLDLHLSLSSYAPCLNCCVGWIRVRIRDATEST